MNTNELTGAALDWAVAKCEHDIQRYNYGEPCFNSKTKRVYETAGLQQIGVNFAPSTDWSQGGPIIERERVGLRGPSVVGAMWAAFVDASGVSQGPQYRQVGPTPLVAAMRCYVASKLGDTVDIPEELIK